MARRASSSEAPTPTISARSSKQELLQAYEEVATRLEHLQAQESASPKARDEEQRRVKTVVDAVAQTSVEGLVKEMASLKLRVASGLDGLAHELVAAREQLAALQEASAHESQRLAELYDIRVAADTLALLVAEHTQQKEAGEAQASERQRQLESEYAKKREALEQEMLDKREAWKKEQQAQAAAVQERERLLKKDREREEEEYQYQLKRKRAMDEDAYRQKVELQERELSERRLAQERELSERAHALAEQEAELTRLRAEAETFPVRLEEAGKRAADEANRRAQEEAKAQAKLVAKETEAAANLAKLQIQTLEKTLGEKEQQVALLRSQLDAASAKVSEIAIRAIEGASGSRAFQTVNEIALEQAKRGGQLSS